MKVLFALTVCCVTVAFAHNSYTGGYSGSGTRYCAGSCHGSTGGTLVVSGFPASYQPQQTYRITVKHNGGVTFVNFNATVHVGTTAVVAGTFSPVTNSILYTGADGGVYANPHLIDSAVFQWTAPATGSGSVTLYAAGFQGTSTSSSSGQSSRLTLTSTEITTGVKNSGILPKSATLSQNYPNPFNPASVIEFILPSTQFVSLTVFNTAGQAVATLVNGEQQEGRHQVHFNANGLSSGIYFYRLESKSLTQTRKMILAK